MINEKIITKKEIIDRLKYLSSLYLNCRLDDHLSNYIPPDLKEGSYRWFLYLYTNLFNENNDIISIEDKQIFIQISEKFRTEHLISWVRNTFYNVKKEKINDVITYINNLLENTNKLYIIRICIYIKRIFSENWFFLDDYILNKIPELKQYVV
jgi:hypothetical protein